MSLEHEGTNFKPFTKIFEEEISKLTHFLQHPDIIAYVEVATFDPVKSFILEYSEESST